MFRIYKITSHPVVDFAAEELKRYLRMMMPQCGEIPIAYDPQAQDGFRLGLMQELGLDTTQAEDCALDDIIHITTDDRGGVIAGSNPRSVLLAVYQYLKCNGCRWLFPGVDGEYIPMQQIQPVTYEKMADCRYRGQCIEGAQSQQALLNAIDFAPKQGLNVYMMQFMIPKIFYDWYYNHFYNADNREPEPVTQETVMQWKCACEAEITKRGLQYHDVGHGWNAESFGVSSLGGWNPDAENPIPPETKQFVAQIDGKRELFKGVALNTNFCTSNPQARKLMIQSVIDYAQLHTNVDYLHVWLADGQRNHCECDACRTKTPSDWYVVLLNEIDEALTARNLDTKIVFVVYSDTAYEPTCEHLKNPKRFGMLLGAITRSYTYSAVKYPQMKDLPPFQLNRSGRPETLEEHLVRARIWKEFAPCDSFVYEYHFWKHQFYAPGVLPFAKRLYEDVLSYRDNDYDGIIQCGTQRAFFPNGFSYYAFAATMFDNSVDLEELKKDYFSHAYGQAWQDVVAFLEAMEEHMPQTYMQARHTANTHLNNFYNPEMEEKLLAVEGIAKHYEAIFRSHHQMPVRCQTVAMRLMTLYTEYCTGLSKAMAIKCMGRDEEAREEAERFFHSFGRHEQQIELYYDHMMMCHALRTIFHTASRFDQ